jgi:ATP-dependent Clp protease adaptor protein ClpS
LWSFAEWLSALIHVHSRSIPLPWQKGRLLVLFFSVMAQTGTIQIDETKTNEDLATPWNVIVHNDPVNLMSYVTMVFMRVFGYPRAKAEMHMLEVHTKGRSLVWSGGREHAELYVHQLHGYQLLATLEKSEP